MRGCLHATIDAQAHMRWSVQTCRGLLQIPIFLDSAKYLWLSVAHVLSHDRTEAPSSCAEWGRIEPQQGCFDPAAIAHYHKIFDCLIRCAATGLVQPSGSPHLNYAASLSRHMAGSDAFVIVIGGVRSMHALPLDLWQSAADRQCWLSVPDGCFSASAPLEDVPIMPCASLSLRAAMQRRPCSNPVQHLPKFCPKTCASSQCLAADPLRSLCLIASQRARPGAQE